MIPTVIPAHPDAAFLSRVLREGPAGEHWPDKFEWDYGDCLTCAMELSKRLWKRLAKDTRRCHPLGTAQTISKQMSINQEVGLCIFLRLDQIRDISSYDITPVDVADALDAAIRETGR